MEINLNSILVLEDSQLQDVKSVAAYIEELAYFKALIDHHTNRAILWDRETPRNKRAFGKIDTFLKELEE